MPSARTPLLLSDCYRPEALTLRKRPRVLFPSRLVLQISEGYVKAGAAKVYISSRDAKSLEAAANEMNKLPGVNGNPCVAIAADLATLEGVESLVKEIAKREKREFVIILSPFGCEPEVPPSRS